MRVSQIVGFLLLFSCIRQNNIPADRQSDTTRSFQTTSTVIDSDSLMLRKLITASDRILGIPKIKSIDNQRVSEINRTFQKSSVRMDIYNQYEFKTKSINDCKGYRHIYLNKKSRNDNQPFEGLYLLIIDSNNKLTDVEKLEEGYHFGSTNTSSWNLAQDSTLTIDFKSHWCSDVQIEYENEVFNHCWTETIHKVYQLYCNGMVLMKRDSVRESSIE